jgi:hypothetical protein
MLLLLLLLLPRTCSAQLHWHPWPAKPSQPAGIMQKTEQQQSGHHLTHVKDFSCTGMDLPFNAAQCVVHTSYVSCCCH